jgi:hypothetical protein
MVGAPPELAEELNAEAEYFESDAAHSAACPPLPRRASRRMAHDGGGGQRLTFEVGKSNWATSPSSASTGQTVDSRRRVDHLHRDMHPDSGVAALQRSID